MLAIVDPKEIVRRGYDLVSSAYRADDAPDGEYAQWISFIEDRVEAGLPVLDLGCGNGVPVARRLSRRYAVTGVDLSEVQIGRARVLVPSASFIRADMASLTFRDASFAAITCFFAMIHLPLEEQPALLQRIGRWLVPGGVFVGTLGHGAWTGVEKDWLGVRGADMWWSHPDASTYRQWLADAGLHIESEAVIPEGKSAHLFVLATNTSP